MKNLLTAAGVLLAALPWLAPAAGAATLPKCSGRVVWVMPPQKAYVLNNNPLYGKTPGNYACESKAIALGYHMRPLNIMRPAQHTASPRSPANGSTSVAGENPDLTKLARAQIDIFRTGKIDRSMYGQQLNAALTDTIVTQWSRLLAVSGNVTAFNYAGATNLSGLPVAQYNVTFEHPIQPPNMTSTNQWIESIAVDQSGKVIYLTFAPKT